MVAGRVGIATQINGVGSVRERITRMTRQEILKRAQDTLEMPAKVNLLTELVEELGIGL